MRIQDCEIIPTKCANMTEESDFKYGMNGGSPIKQEAPAEHRNIASPERAPSEKLVPQVCAGGGRLKFFKDGKFILELERARAGWVSVPRKTFWPPAAPPIAPGPRQEGSTSLSVSDDNSSVQSSPWQRDHCWKQASPQRAVSQETSFYYARAKRAPPSRLMSLRKRRRPFDQSTPDDNSASTNGVTTYTRRKTGQLAAVLQRLWDRNGGSVKQLKQAVVTAEQIVSPRKRILRELERVTLDDLYNKRRAKVTQASTTTVTSTSVSTVTATTMHNGSIATTVTTPHTSRSSSYSIDSLLGNNSSADVTDSKPPQQWSNSGQHHRYQSAPHQIPLPYSSSSSYYGHGSHVYPTYPPRYAALWSQQYHPSLLASYAAGLAPPAWPAHTVAGAHRAVAGIQPPLKADTSHVDEDLPLNLSKNSR